MSTNTETLLADKPLPGEQSLPQKPDKITRVGYLMLAISAILFGIEDLYDAGRDNDNLTIFFIHYFLSIGYVFVLLVDRAYGVVRSWQNPHLHKTIVLLMLFLVSAFALNRQLPVFEDSVTWLCVYLVLTSAVMLSYQFFDLLPRSINIVQHVLLGSTLVLYLYMTIFVANFYIPGTVGILLLGVGGHVLVPALLFGTAIRLVVIIHEKWRAGTRWMVFGIVLTMGVITAFLTEWNARVNSMERIVNNAVLNPNEQLPLWLKLAASIRIDWISERILKADLVYAVTNDQFQKSFMRRNRDWDEKKKHDPLVFIASAFNASSMPDHERRNVLSALTDGRHRGQERLWSGDNLTTSDIVTDVDIYTDLRIAYAEQYFSIRNNDTRRRWNTNEEAIYTFQLPEGSVVTSLSLWVNGKEEKGILTTKQKATKAYTTIVGTEMRDPSVVHWQEGNTVSVRVFPCTREEERKFKIGITSPLAVDGDRVVFNNVTFKGPNASGASQVSRVRIVGNTHDLELPGSFLKNEKGAYVREGSYEPDMTISFARKPIRPNQFSFDGFTYSVAERHAALSKMVFEKIYLDINQSWTRDEAEALRELPREYELYVYSEDEFVKLSDENRDDLIASLMQRNFSLFPFHQMQAPETSLVITKGRALSPHLADFKASRFARGISDYFGAGKKTYVFNLDGGASTYVRSLNELRAFNYAEGDIGLLKGFLEDKKFSVTEESDEKVVLHDSDMVIEKKKTTGELVANTAPDHLARLFAYNNIMRQVGVNFFHNNFVDDALVKEASKAYVVSPVSSLIVLETQQDYERFGIEDIDNSLQNASKQLNGAVPEPHEWALIIVFLAFVAFHLVRHSRYKMLFVRK